jgi:hypothetical protein
MGRKNRSKTTMMERRAKLNNQTFKMKSKDIVKFSTVSVQYSTNYNANLISL